VTRLTVVPLRSSPIQGNDKNLGPLSTPNLGNLTSLSGNKRYRHQPEFPLWNPEWLTVYPELPVWNFYLARVKTFSGHVCSIALTLTGTQVRDADEVGTTAFNCKIVFNKTNFQNRAVWNSGPNLSKPMLDRSRR
jgi:hypothetical protein